MRETPFMNDDEAESSASDQIFDDICGLVINGYPLLYKWKRVSNTAMWLDLGSSIDHKTVKDLTIFFLPNAEQKLSQDSSLALYYSTAPPFNMWTILGGISHMKRSATFSVNWARATNVRLGLSIEPRESIENLEKNGSIEKTKRREDIGLQVAQDAYNYLSSFAEIINQDGQEKLVMPANSLEKWLQRFKRRFLWENS